MATDRLAAETSSTDFWRSLYYFNLYRLTLVSLFLFLSGMFGSALPLGARNLPVFFVTSGVYALVVAASFVMLRLRWPRLTWQLAFQIGGDIVFLSVLSYASGGIQSNVSLLLMVSLAAGGMISRSRITLFFASVASIAALLEHSYAVLYADAEVVQYAQVGLLCMAYFAVAWLIHLLARYAVDSQLLAQRRGRDLVSLSEANRLVMRDMQDGVLVVDGVGVVTQMNPRAGRLLHRWIGTGLPLAEVSPVLAGHYAVWRRTGNTSQETLELEGGVAVCLRFVAIEQDAALGTVIFLEDVQRVRAEAQQIKLAALGRLTANIAHEVRNPLSAISYAAELLREEQGDSKQQRLIQIVLDNTQRINQIVQDVMQLNRRDRAQPETFDSEPVLRAFVEEFCLAEHTGSDIVVLEAAPGMEVRFDRGHLHQVLWNLCRNALRYGRRLPGSLRLALRIEDGFVVLEVRDDGPGISAEQQGKLFEPFFTTSPDGTGLGLYVARELCEANGARLEYRRAGSNSAGACFRITFGEHR